MLTQTRARTKYSLRIHLNRSCPTPSYYIYAQHVPCRLQETFKLTNNCQVGIMPMPKLSLGVSVQVELGACLDLTFLYKNTNETANTIERRCKSTADYYQQGSTNVKHRGFELFPTNSIAGPENAMSPIDTNENDVCQRQSIKFTVNMVPRSGQRARHSCLLSFHIIKISSFSLCFNGCTCF